MARLETLLMAWSSLELMQLLLELMGCSALISAAAIGVVWTDSRFSGRRVHQPVWPAEANPTRPLDAIA